MRNPLTYLLVFYKKQQQSTFHFFNRNLPNSSPQLFLALYQFRRRIRKRCQQERFPDVLYEYHQRNTVSDKNFVIIVMRRCIHSLENYPVGQTLHYFLWKATTSFSIQSAERSLNSWWHRKIEVYAPYLQWVFTYSVQLPVAINIAFWSSVLPTWPSSILCKTCCIPNWSNQCSKIFWRIQDNRSNAQVASSKASLHLQL